jgi:hypothetical protein
MRKSGSFDIRSKKTAARPGRLRAGTGKAGARDAARIRRLRQAIERLQAKAQAGGLSLTSADHAAGLYDD